MFNQQGKVTKSDNFAVVVIVLIIAISFFITIFWISNHNHHLQGLNTLLSDFIAGISALGFAFGCLMQTEADGKILKIKIYTQRFCCLSALVLALISLRIATIKPPDPCTPDKATTQHLLLRLNEKESGYLKQLSTVDNDRDGALTDSLDSLRKKAIGETISEAGLNDSCQLCYTGILNAMRTDSLAFLRDSLDTLEAIESDLNTLWVTKDMDGIPSFLQRHRIGSDANVLKLVNNEWGIVGHLEPFLMDALQRGIEVRLMPVFRNGFVAHRRHPIIDFIIPEQLKS